jgi:hypothetical protein
MAGRNGHTPHTHNQTHTHTHTHTHTGSECPISRVSNDAHAFLDAWFTVVQQLWRFMVIWSIRHPVTRGEAANANGIEWRWRWRWSGPGLVGCGPRRLASGCSCLSPVMRLSRFLCANPPTRIPSICPGARVGNAQITTTTTTALVLAISH